MYLQDSYNLVAESNRRYINLTGKGLKTLVGQNIPKRVEGSFFCSDNKLTSLEGAPEYVGGGFYCDRNLKKGENLYASNKGMGSRKERY